jgi:broad specificity phosphatase PhoE
VGDPQWLKPGNFDLEVYVSEYSRAQQTARICLDQMGLLSAAPKIRALLNERNYGTTYLNIMDQDPTFAGNDSESAVRARVRMRTFQAEVEPVLDRADVLAFSHFGALRALIANLRGLSDAEMMTFDVPNGGLFLFERLIHPDGTYAYQEVALPSPVLPRTAPKIEEPSVGLPANLR